MDGESCPAERKRFQLVGPGDGKSLIIGCVLAGVVVGLLAIVNRYFP